MNSTNWQKKLAGNLRIDVLKATTLAKSGHPTSCLSAVEIMVSLFWEIMHHDPYAYQYPNNDRFILSKGHAAPLLYAIWKEFGIINESELSTLRTFQSPLEGHPTARFAYHEAATGSLGQGLAIGIGEALAARLNQLDYRTFVLMGDSELAEGSVWEAAQIAAYYKLNNLIAYIDANRLGQRGESLLGTNYEQCAKKWETFGWDAHIIDGHNIEEISKTGLQIRANATKPTVILAKTIKGFGLGPTIENKNGFHGKALSEKEYQEYLKNHPYTAIKNLPHPPRPSLKSRQHKEPSQHIDSKQSNSDNYLKPTRKVYGESLKFIGEHDNSVVALDAEVKNSTFSQIFEDSLPERFIECFIAEQSMIGIATGLAQRGFIPFCSTFAAFLTRAYDQIRMAAIGRVPLRICGSHAGVSIGEDGPSQMGLEDIALMRALPKSIIFYPADKHATKKCMELMHQYKDGISYIRTTREATPTIYSDTTSFIIGGCHTIEESNNDDICIVTAGITLFEAIKAQKELKKDSISARIIDCYSIKPLPVEKLIRAAKSCKNTMITIEDHYQAGGLGEAIKAILPTPISCTNLYVDKLPQSGSPEELRAYMAIDAAHIVLTIKQICLMQQSTECS